MKEIILRHLQNYGTITTWEAINEYGCTRLSEYIRQLRSEYEIESEYKKFTNRYGEKSKYVKYILKNN